MRDSGRGSFFRTAAFLLIILSVVWLTPAKALIPWAGMRTVFVRAVYPFQYAAYKTVTGVNYFFVSVRSLRSAQEVNEAYKVKLETEKAIHNVFEALVAENRSLREKLSFRDSNPFGFGLIPAEVIVRSPSAWFNTVRIDKGARDGIYPGRAVVTSKGLVGRVIDTSDTSSLVLLITDNSSFVSVRIKKTSDIGSLKGAGGGDPLLRYIHSNAAVNKGDAIVTSGISDHFPQGIPVGTVERIVKRDFDLFQRIEIRTAADFSDLSVVFVVK